MNIFHSSVYEHKKSQHFPANCCGALCHRPPRRSSRCSAIGCFAQKTEQTLAWNVPIGYNSHLHKFSVRDWSTPRQSLSTHSPLLDITSGDSTVFHQWGLECEQSNTANQTRGELNYDSFPNSETAQRQDLSLAPKTL